MNRIALPFSHADYKTQDPVVTLLLGGDLCPIGRYEKKLLTGEPVFDSQMRDAFQTADLTIVNLEAPLCNKDVPSGYPSGSGLRADPAIAKSLMTLGIDVAGLANNHIRDFGDIGVRQTIDSLSAAGISSMGAGMNLAEAHQPWVQEIQGLRIGILALAERELNVASSTRAGSSWFVPHENAAEITALRKQVDFVLVFLHAGHEFTTAPSPRIRQACRAMVDAGADAVISHHPHVVQGAERYKDALIAYSLGNLVFDSSYVSAYEHTDVGYLVNLQITRHAIVDAQIMPYRLGPDFVVRGLVDQDFNHFAYQWPSLCAMITDDARFHIAWEENVRFRWETEYRSIVRNLSARFDDVQNKDYALRTSNVFHCPTHVEMIVSAMELLQQGRLDR